MRFLITIGIVIGTATNTLWAQRSANGDAVADEAIFCCGGVVAQLVDGGPWKSIIQLVNFEKGATASYRLRFFTNTGQPMFLPTNVGVVSSISGVLPINGSRIIETLGTQLTTQEGWAFVDTRDHIGGFTVFRLKLNSSTPAVEVTSPVDTGIGNVFRFPFDGVSATAGIAIVNALSSTINVIVIVRDEAGAQITIDSLSLAPLAKTTFVLNDRYPAVVGKRGTVEISTSASILNVLGLRSTVDGSSITLTSMAPQSEIPF